MEIPKNSYACANCHQRFNNPTILIKHDELRHTIAKRSQTSVWNTKTREISTSIENRDLPENTSNSVVPFELSHPISIGMERDPLEISIKDEYEEISNQEFKSKKNDTMGKYPTSVHTGKKTFKCDMCDKNFVDKQVISRHIASVHEGKKPFKCEICESSFSNKRNLKLHIASVHESKKTSRCEICD